MAYPSVPNTSDVARRLSVSRAAVSRWRSGNRLPQMKQRQAIEKAYGWSVADQAVAESQQRWAAGFNAVLERSEATV